MKHRNINAGMAAVLILGAMLTACQPTPAVETALPEPTDIPATPTPEPVEASPEEQFLDQHGFVVISTEDERFPVVALGADGEVLAPLLREGDELSTANVEGAVWLDERSNQEVVVSLGEDGLPARMQIGEYVVIFSDYTESTVSVGLFQGETLLQTAANVALDGELYTRYRELLSGSTQGSSSHGAVFSVMPPGERSREARMFEMVGLIVNLTACTAALAFPPSAWFAVTACGATLLSAVTTFTGEDLDIFGTSVPLVVVDAVGCIGAAHALSCVTMIIDAIAIVVDAFHETQEAYEYVYDEVLEDLSCASWFVYAETTWNGCANCATGPDLAATREDALAACQEVCGQPCQIMREPYCEVEP